MPSHYQVLGVARGASLEAIRAAYRELARVEHPDVKPSADHSRMVQINLAYRVLSDPASRAKYDRALDETGAGSAGSPAPGSGKSDRAAAEVEARAAPRSDAVSGGSATRARAPSASPTASGDDASSRSRPVSGGDHAATAVSGKARSRAASGSDDTPAAVGGTVRSRAGSVRIGGNAFGASPGRGDSSAAVGGETAAVTHLSPRKKLVRWLSGTAYAALVVATIIGARRLAAPSGESDSAHATPSAQPPTPPRPALPQAARDPCPPIQCPAGATEHQELANGTCKRWCTDARGTTLASSTSRALTAPVGEPIDPQQLARQRLTCRSQPGRAPTCSLGGGDIELGALPAAAVSGWQVVKAEGAAPVARGTRCELHVLPVPAAISGEIPYNCRLNLRCGALIYGGGSAGFGLCDVASGVLRGAVDPLAAASDGDPALVLDVVKGRLLVADATWRLSLTSLMLPPKGSASD